MTEQGREILEVLAAEGPEMPIALLARRLGLPPTRLVPLLDDLYDAGLVRPGAERATVALVPAGDGRFTRPASDRDGRSTRAH